MDQIGECHFADHRRALGSLLAAGFRRADARVERMMRLSSIGCVADLHYRCFVKGPLTTFNIEKFTIMETIRHRAGSPKLRERWRAIQQGDITLDNPDPVAFEAATEIITRLGNDLDISVRGAVLQLYKERDRIINMGTSLPDDRHSDARDVADRIDDGLRLLNPDQAAQETPRSG